MEILEIASKLQLETDKLSDEIISELRKDDCYLKTLADLERKIAVMIANDHGSILIKVINRKITF